MARDGAQRYAATAWFDKEQDEVCRQFSPGQHLRSEEVGPGEHVQVRPAECLAGRRATPLGRWSEIVPTPGGADCSIRNRLAQIRQRAHNPVISRRGFRVQSAPRAPPPPVRPEGGPDRHDAGMNFRATNRRYQSRIVSGLATRVISFMAFRPSRLAISAKLDRSASDSRSRLGRWALRMRFSAARYSLRSNNS
jgi:hypothetical protein